MYNKNDTDSSTAHRVGSRSDSSIKTDRRLFVSAAAAATATLLSPGVTRADSEKKWQIGVIGHTGRGNYGHGLHTVWLELPETKIVGLADADRTGLELTQKKLGVENAFTDYREMIKQVRPEIVSVCPRHIDQRRDMVLAAVEGGARGIYCEKPLCQTPREADEIVAACERSGTRLAIAHRNRYHPALPVVAAAIDEGLIGKPLEIRCRGKEDGRGGAEDMWVLGTHLFDLARQFSGNAQTCSAVLLAGVSSVTPEDVIAGPEGIGPIAGDRLHARYDTESGVPLFFDSIRNAGVRAAGFGLQLIGTEGLIDFRIDSEPLAHFVPGSPFQPTSKPRPWIPISSAGVGKPETISNLKKLVAEHILPTRDLLASITEERLPLSSVQDGRAVVEMIHAAFASHVNHGQRVRLPLASREHPFTRWN